jgi:hypothetical protein
LDDKKRMLLMILKIGYGGDFKGGRKNFCLRQVERFLSR